MNAITSVLNCENVIIIKQILGNNYFLFKGVFHFTFDIYKDGDSVLQLKQRVCMQRMYPVGLTDS